MVFVLKKSGSKAKREKRLYLCGAGRVWCGLERACNRCAHFPPGLEMWLLMCVAQTTIFETVGIKAPVKRFADEDGEGEIEPMKEASPSSHLKLIYRGLVLEDGKVCVCVP